MPPLIYSPLQSASSVGVSIRYERLLMSWLTVVKKNLQQQKGKRLRMRRILRWWIRRLVVRECRYPKLDVERLLKEVP